MLDNPKKIWISYLLQLGLEGDMFRVFGGLFMITKVHKKRLGFVAEHFYDREGCGSEEEYMAVWRRTHPKRNKPEQSVYVHEFKKNRIGGNLRLLSLRFCGKAITEWETSFSWL
jgi:hypothetical protein